MKRVRTSLFLVVALGLLAQIGAALADMLGKGFEKLLDSLISLGYEPESLMP
jgi:hypothetical protein